ncbi:cellobiose phosphorylase [Wenzhouxiangella sp. AB-CW3]|uniref:GH36-type glycosyl hydrolase domain-containing protein n=1 Tax=Wenzhouxiangella sp. AB-CW3 TaxID=2771012 RepID=UPI00168C0A1B|nr:glucoamylase family protein [Wenzhouxiangella sp. AB-CW3]QOC24035.1 cellobiose phosphorylase [Wenzhouxiangella sp. AB-CW3]
MSDYRAPESNATAVQPDLERDLRELARKAGNVVTARAVPLQLQDRRQRLQGIYSIIDRLQVAGHTVTRAEEWLLDNRHVIEDAISGLRSDMPAGFVRSLPQVSVSQGSTEPLVASLARILLTHGGEPVELDWMEGNVERFQDHRALTIGELWALPAFITLGVIDHLIEVGEELTADIDDTVQGDRVDIIDTVAGGILGLRALAAHDWPESFERLSRVDRILARDPAGAYADMDFLTRDRYRRRVEQLSRYGSLSETAVAERAVALSESASSSMQRHRHVGYWLIGGGFERLRREAGFRPGLRQRVLDLAERRPGGIYFALIAGFSAVPIAALASVLQYGCPVWALVLVVLLALVPVIGLSVALANGLITWLVPPRTLARMDFAPNGIPESFRTAVTVPVIFAGVDDVEPVFERLEVNYLANDDPSLVYVVLGDLRDADQPETPADAHILKRCMACIRRLNRQYGDRFVFMSRQRLWNDSEGCWMGWERKRGKLMEFNRVLAGDGDTSYSVVHGEKQLLEGIRYVLTLDADTRLPPGTARQLVGTLAHPLSHAVYDNESRMLKAGYGIIQPRLEVDPDTTMATLFTRIFSGDTTMDLYTHASSDVYHDLFGEGIFTGKGIYDWRAVEHTLAGRIPDNSLLSHDLLEGVHARVGLASDIVLMEQFPASVVAFMRRQHRWTRGDWQLLPWLRQRVRVADNSWRRNPLRPVHRWKIIDNLRRSLQPPVVLALILLSLSGLLPGIDWVWMLLFALLMGPGLLTEWLEAFGRGAFSPRSAWPRLRRFPRAFRLQLQYWLLNLVLLPYQSAMLLDAAARALLRMSLTRRHLLEWTSAAHTQRSLGSARRHLWREMWTAPLLAVLTTTGILLFNPSVLLPAAPLLLGWMVAPMIAGVVDQTRVRPAPVLSESDRDLLRRIGRRTWLFFERFVGPDTHWLPPDNFQEDPRVMLAERTSPTNIGLALNSALAAHDMGWLDSLTLAAWLGNLMDGMAQLERHRGHWLNWYELRDLNRLEPAYVSTVDSGNLAVALSTLAQGLDELIVSPLDVPRLLKGVSDTLGVIAETVEALPGAVPANKRSRHLLVLINQQRQELAGAGPEDTRRLLQQWQQQYFDRLADEVIGLAEDREVVVSAEAIRELRIWLDELQSQAHRATHMLECLLPWVDDLSDLEQVCDSVESDVAPQWQQLLSLLKGQWRLSTWVSRSRRVLTLIAQLQDKSVKDQSQSTIIERLARQLDHAQSVASKLRSDFQEISRQASAWAAEMDFRFLYDKERHLFRIGYDVSNATPDPNFYDLLASEARLASLWAIANGQVPPRHWLFLGRPFRRRHGRSILMSWGATLFEYMMPRLYAQTPSGSLLDNASRAAIDLHRSFADRHQIPWGISESAYYQLDEQQVYAYRAFGVPGLGFKRDLGERLVVAPYSSIMALPFDPLAVVDNLRRIKALRGIGLYGCYEALDFGRRTRPEPRRLRVVKAWMSHHQGMALVAIANYLNNDIMVHRFHSDPHVAGVSMLLHERLPRVVPELPTPSGASKSRAPHVAPDPLSWSVEPRSDVPNFTLLSNGQYSITINAAGGGGSQWQGIMISRWQPDVTTNRSGQWVYVHDLDADQGFSISADPAGNDSADRQVQFGAHFAEFRCRSQNLLCRMRLGVAAQHDIEARKLLISNESDQPRRLLVASFAELAMAKPDEFERHPAFARLFIESECLDEEQILLFRRRPRSSNDRPLYVAHALVPPTGQPVRFGWDTDRQQFLGRAGSRQRPAGLEKGVASMGANAGAIVDPVMATALEIEIEPYGRVEMGLLVGAGRSRRELLAAMRSYRAIARIDWIFEQARMQTGLELHHLQMPPENIRGAMRLASAVHAPQRQWRRAESSPAQALQALLWSRGISGDWPIIVMEVTSKDSQERIEELITAHTFLSGRRQRTDLVLLDLSAGGYEQASRDRLREISESVRSRIQRVLVGQISVIPARELSAEQYQALIATASVILDASGPPIAEQLVLQRDGAHLPLLVPSRQAPDAQAFTPPMEACEQLQHDNGYGAFSQDGGEYIIHWTEGAVTPAPWCNVLANPDFGCLVTERGASFTWAGNSSEYRLTPWSNDPVLDDSGDVLYVRDEETGLFWCPTPGPRPGQGEYRVHHGMGYSRFVHHGNGLVHDYRVHVDPDRNARVCRLQLTNHCNWTRRLTVTRYLEWVMGNRRSEPAVHLECGISVARQVLLARNRFDRFGGSKHAFLVSSLPMHGFTTDRTEFLGQGGDVDDPAAMHRIGLSGQVQPGTDPCAALQVHLDIPPGETLSVVFILGHADSRAQALELAAELADEDAAEKSFSLLNENWQELLGNVQVSTPDSSFNLLLNRWLPYQAISARLNGRTGFYQSSGGFGFRDQLQDSMAMVWLDPQVTRQQILRAASRQFAEGDVLHWWHESPLRGVRTRCSDDLLWLPLVTAWYVRSTGDTGVLDEQVRYLSGQPLAAEEVERYAEYGEGERAGSLYEHCCRALDRASTVGPHGLPIIGNGDWNDGFNRISTTGRGESVWLAWFMMRVLLDFAECCRHKNDPDIESQYRALARQLGERADAQAWDGDWYHRAYYDDGTAIGSARNEECSMDLIAQAWSVLGPDQPGERAQVAMRSALKRLVDGRNRLILLLDPPFDKTPRDPGYIKGYPPGIRENGAQYTHAATWAVWAAARLGWRDEAARLFRILDPIQRVTSPQAARHYRVEPYVLAGDVYSQGRNRGRGGWSWYTGAAAWLYRAGIEAMLGLRVEHHALVVDPCLPPDWDSCSVTIKVRGCAYRIQYEQEKPGKGTEPGLTIYEKGRKLASNRIPIADEAGDREITVRVVPEPE